MPKEKEKDFYTMQDLVGSLFLKFYDEQLIYSFGTDAENQIVHNWATEILKTTEELTAKKSALDSETSEIKKAELKKEHDALVEKKKQQHKDMDNELHDIVKNEGYFQMLCSIITAFPSVPDEESGIKASDCYYAGLILHDKDFYKDDIYNPMPEKYHYHLAIRTAPIPGKRVRQIRVSTWLKMLCLKYRPELDDELIRQKGIDVCRDFNQCMLYLIHRTEKSEFDGKYPYSRDELVTNLENAYLSQIFQGLHRIDALGQKLTMKAWAELETTAFNAGFAAYKWHEFFDTFPFNVRAQLATDNSKTQLIHEAFNKGLMAYLNAHEDDFLRHAIYIQGEGSVGKTTTAKHALVSLGYDKSDIFQVGKDTAKYDSYNDERAIVADDTGLSDIRRVTESHYVRLKKRGRGESLWYGDCVIITANDNFIEFCIRYTLGAAAGHRTRLNELTHSEARSVRATMSRFTLLEADSETCMVSVKEYASREKGEKSRRTIDFANRFVKAYNDDMSAYLSKLFLEEVAAEEEFSSTPLDEIFDDSEIGMTDSEYDAFIDDNK